MTGKKYSFLVDRIPFVRNRFDMHMREIVNGAAIAMGAKVAGAGISFYFNVLLARLVGAEGTGLFYLALSIVTVATIFGRMGLDNALLRFTAAHASIGDWTSVKGLYEKGMTLAFCASSASSIVVFIAAPWLAVTVFSKPSLAMPLRWMSLSIVPVSLLFLHAEMLKGLKHIFDYALVYGQNGVLLSAFSVSVLYLLGGAMGTQGAIISYVAAVAVTALVSYLLWLRATPQIRGISGHFKMYELLRSSMPLFWVTSMNIVLNLSATFFLGIWGTAAEVGIFSIASRTAMLASFVLMAFNSIAAPKFAALYVQGDMKTLGKTARNSAKLMTLLVSPIVLTFVLIPHQIMGLFGSNFVEGGSLLVILAIGQFVNVATGSVGYLLMMSGNEVLMRNAIAFTAVVNIILNLVLVPLTGMLGAAIATSASLVVVNLLSAYFVWTRLGIATLPFIWRERKA